MINGFKVDDYIKSSISTLINKFREHPDIFFTEPDLHSYLYHNLYTTKLESKTLDCKITNCVHREYPTNFRYSKDTMEEYGLDKRGKRGNSDLVVLNSDFIEKNTLHSVASRHLSDVEERSKNEADYRKEVHSVIEMKYVTTNSKSYLDEVINDNQKLLYGLKYQDFNAYNLVFCNVDYHHKSELEKLVKTTCKKIACKLIITYYKNGEKESPKPISNQYSE
jgi:hypothetical protein